MPHFVIEKNVPLPDSVIKGRAKYPFKELEVNDSFSAPLELLKTIRSIATRWGKILNRKFVVAKLENEVRVWRIS